MAEWSVSQEKALGDTERTIAMLKAASMAAELWLKEMTHEFSPDDLDDELGRRITMMIWQMSFVKCTVMSTNPMEAFDQIAQFMVKLGVPGLVVQTFDDEELMDKTLLATEQIRLEQEQERGEDEG